MRIAAAVLFLSLSATSVLADKLVAVESRFGVKETLDRLVAELGKRDIKVVARLDHAANAKTVGMDLRPNEVVMFGNPKLGTPLMQLNPEIGVDLPMRMLAWQDKAGKVWIGYPAPDALKARHGISDGEQQFKAMAVALDGLVKIASGQ
jgi:uncharacterized protein (DUF302 family)